MIEIDLIKTNHKKQFQSQNGGVGGLPPSPSNVPKALFVNANGQPHCKTSVGLTNSRQLTLNVSIVLSPAVLVTKDSASAFKMVPKVECK